MTAERFSEIRNDSNLSQTEFGRRLGLSQGHVSHIEAGRKKIPPLVAAVLSASRLRNHFLRGAVKVEEEVAH